MAQVKGSMFINFAKAINADKKGTYDKYLTDADRQVLSRLILQSAWYPYETYKNCFQAVAAEVAQNDPETLRNWGREYGQQAMESVYKLALKKDTPQEAMDAYQMVLKNQFDFCSMKSRMASDNEITLTIEGVDSDFESWYYVAQGWIERFLQLCLKTPVTSEIVDRSWEGAPATVFKLSW